MHEEHFLALLREQGIDVVASLPCDKARELFFRVEEEFTHVGLTREEDGIGVCAGACLAGGKPALLLQSSGLGNSLNALMSLTVTYRLPLPIVASWRGVWHETIPAQVPFNAALPRVLDALGIPWTVFEQSGDLERIRGVIETAYRNSSPYVALVSPQCWEGNEPPGPSRTPANRRRSVRRTCSHAFPEPQMTRNDAIRTVAEYLDDQAVIANIGIPGRELFAAGDRPLNFYMLGSYTQASPIGLGVALRSTRDVLVIDGDGSMLGTGILPVIAGSNPENLTILCLDNGVFGSTGNQPTPSYGTADLEQIARASGFLHTTRVHRRADLQDALEGRGPGPNFLHVVLKPGNADVPTIPLSPESIRDRFMRALQE